MSPELLPSEERRRCRSERPAEAARLYLEHLASRAGFAALALADADGLLIAGTRGAFDTEAVAAVAPLTASATAAEHDGLLALVTRGLPLRVWSVDLDGVPCFLAGVGGEASHASAAADDAAASLRRILASR